MDRRDPPASEITPSTLYVRRREWMKNVGLAAVTATAVGGSLVALVGDARRPRMEGRAPPLRPLPPASPSGVPPRRDPRIDPLTRFEDVTTYNNFYEFGAGKSEPAQYAWTLRPRPWSVAIEGEVERPRVVDIDELLRELPIEERVYRMRCVEAWSMVIPWIGIPLRELVRRVEPTSRAKFVEFTSLADEEQMPDLDASALRFPYIEGLRIDEAVHPLTLLAVGLYGKSLLNQNGAPLRLVVPWKYGFKGGKSIVRIRFTEQQPRTTWSEMAPREYGFYANVNPTVDHPRWSQATERRIGELDRRITLAFNGYAEDVAGLYAGMDLGRYY